MDWGSLIGPASIAAGVSATISMVGLIVSTQTAKALHREKLKSDEQLTERKFEFDKDLASRKFEFDKQLATHKLEVDTALAEKKVQLDAAFADRKRQQELAEGVLADFLGLPALVRAIRSPMSFGGEAKDRVRQPNETESVSRQRDAFFAILARFENNRKDIAGLLAKRNRMEAMFGRSAGEPFQKVQESLNKVLNSARLLVAWADQNIPNRELIHRMEGDIWDGVADPDPVAVKIDEAVGQIEAICSPIIRNAE